MMTPAAYRLNQSPILTTMLLGAGQGSHVALRLLPPLPQALNGFTLAQMGNETKRRYNLRRAPGATTKRVEIKFEGKTYAVDQDAVDVAVPREYLRDADETQTLDVNQHLDISKMAINTVMDVVNLDYELEVAGLVTNPATYAAGHVRTLAGSTKWSNLYGTPVADVREGVNVIRKKIGQKPNTLILSPDAQLSLETSIDVRGYMSSAITGPVSLDALKEILDIEEIFVGDAIWDDGTGVLKDVWGNSAVLAYVPKIGDGKDGAAGPALSLQQPAFGFTSAIEGHPIAEVPYYSPGAKSWVYGAIFERRPNVVYATAGYLFQNVK